LNFVLPLTAAKIYDAFFDSLTAPGRALSTARGSLSLSKKSTDFFDKKVALRSAPQLRQLK
jgi:hypothetical protein